jgi:hypothetical protein
MTGERRVMQEALFYASVSSGMSPTITCVAKSTASWI